MKKYGIISLNIYEKDNNWGSVLQSYALQEFVKKNKFDIEVINICPKFINKFEAKYPIVRVFPFKLGILKNSFRNSVLNFKTYINRDNKFKKFIKNNYNVSKKYTEKTLQSSDYNGFIVGSDIVWNIDFTNGFDKLYFCDLEQIKKRNNISYAPSMCDREMSLEEEQIFRNKLLNFKHISVREKSFVPYVQKFTDKKVQFVIDPTLLLKEEDYIKFISDRIIAEKYILVYTVPTDKSLVEYAKQYARENNLKVVLVECLQIQKKDKECMIFNDAGIEEWLNLVKNAERVFTNSFHACIFSILFRVQFHVVYRNPGKTKIENLCSELGILNYSEKTYKYSFDTSSSIDYDNVYKKLDMLRKESADYLIEAMNRG